MMLISLSEMKHNLHYVVVKGARDTFRKGDHVRKEKCDDSIICVEAGGWIKKEDWIDLCHVRVRASIETIYQTIQEHHEKILELKEVLRQEESKSEKVESRCGDYTEGLDDACCYVLELIEEAKFAERASAGVMDVIGTESSVNAHILSKHSELVLDSIAREINGNPMRTQTVNRRRA